MVLLVLVKLATHVYKHNTIKTEKKARKRDGSFGSIAIPIFSSLEICPFFTSISPPSSLQSVLYKHFFPRILPISHSLFFHSPCFVHWLQCCNLLGWHRQLQLLCRIFLTDSLLILFRVQCFPFCVSVSLDMFYAIFSRAEGGL